MSVQLRRMRNGTFLAKRNGRQGDISSLGVERKKAEKRPKAIYGMHCALTIKPVILHSPDLGSARDST